MIVNVLSLDVTLILANLKTINKTHILYNMLVYLIEIWISQISGPRGVIIHANA